MVNFATVMERKSLPLKRNENFAYPFDPVKSSSKEKCKNTRTNSLKMENYLRVLSWGYWNERSASMSLQLSKIFFSSIIYHLNIASNYDFLNKPITQRWVYMAQSKELELKWLINYSIKAGYSIYAQSEEFGFVAPAQIYFHGKTTPPYHWD